MPHYRYYCVSLGKAAIILGLGVGLACALTRFVVGKPRTCNRDALDAAVQALLEARDCSVVVYACRVSDEHADAEAVHLHPGVPAREACRDAAPQLNTTKWVCWFDWDTYARPPVVRFRRQCPPPVPGTVVIDFVDSAGEEGQFCFGPYYGCIVSWSGRRDYWYIEPRQVEAIGRIFLERGVDDPEAWWLGGHQ